MQTFIAYKARSEKRCDIIKTFCKTAKILDMKRLGKQRVEAMQILDILVNNKQVAWKNHPAVKQWKGSEMYLFIYIQKICSEWISRGYKDSCLEKSTLIAKNNKLGNIIPKFLTSLKFVKSHRSNLLRKNLEFYSKYFGNLRSDLPYEWWSVDKQMFFHTNNSIQNDSKNTGSTKQTNKTQTNPRSSKMKKSVNTKQSKKSSDSKKLLNPKMITEIAKNAEVSEKNTRILASRKYSSVKDFLLDLGKAVKTESADGVPSRKLFADIIKKYRKDGKVFANA